MLKTCQQLPARSRASPGCQLGCPGPVGGRGAGGEPLPPINPEQSPSAARESSDLSPDCLTWLLSPKRLAAAARAVETHEGPPALEPLQGTCRGSLWRAGTLGAPQDRDARPAALCSRGVLMPPPSGAPAAAGSSAGHRGLPEPSRGWEPRQAGMPRGRQPAASA